MTALNVLITYLIIYIFMKIGPFLYFSKAGEPGWKAFIPVYGSYVNYKIAWNTKSFLRIVIYVLIVILGFVGFFIVTVSAINTEEVNAIINEYDNVIVENEENREELIKETVDKAIDAINVDFANLAVWCIVSCIGVLFFVGNYMRFNIHLAKSFGMGLFFASGLIVLPFVFRIILGVNNAEYCQYSTDIESDNLQEIPKEQSNS